MNLSLSRLIRAVIDVEITLLYLNKMPSVTFALCGQPADFHILMLNMGASTKELTFPPIDLVALEPLPA